MNDFQKTEMEEALQAITSMITRTEEAKEKFAPGTSQHTLQKNRLKALKIASSLISKELAESDALDYDANEDLKEALAPIASLISKSEKAQAKLAPGTWQHTMLSKNLKALYIASPLLTKALSEVSAGTEQKRIAMLNTTGSCRLILDTDIGPDCDDAGALACAHALQSMGHCQLLAVTHCTSNPYGAGCIDAINRWYGRGDIPVGTLGKAGFLCAPEHSKYNRFIAEHYPNRYPDGRGVPDAVAVLRQTLASQADGSVTLCAIGPLVNLSDLLRSGADEASPLTGRELVAQKACRLVVMGGGLAEPEWNFLLDRDAAANVCENWPGEVWFSVFEVGGSIITGLAWDDAVGNPIADAYRLYAPQGRMSWDQTALWAAVMGPEPLFSLSEPGDMLVTPDGMSRFTPRAGGQRRILGKTAPDADIEQAIDALMHRLPENAP